MTESLRVMRRVGCNPFIIGAFCVLSGMLCGCPRDGHAPSAEDEAAVATPETPNEPLAATPTPKAPPLFDPSRTYRSLDDATFDTRPMARLHGIWLVHDQVPFILNLALDRGIATVDLKGGRTQAYRITSVRSPCRIEASANTSLGLEALTLTVAVGKEDVFIGRADTFGVVHDPANDGRVYICQSGNAPIIVSPAGCSFSGKPCATYTPHDDGFTVGVYPRSKPTTFRVRGNVVLRDGIEYRSAKRFKTHREAMKALKKL